MKKKEKVRQKQENKTKKLKTKKKLNGWEALEEREWSNDKTFGEKCGKRLTGSCVVPSAYVVGCWVNRLVGLCDWPGAGIRY